MGSPPHTIGLRGATSQHLVSQTTTDNRSDVMAFSLLAKA